MSTAVQDLSIKEAFDAYQKQSDTIHKLWTYFQVVSALFIAYVFEKNKVDWECGKKMLIAAGYLLFAGSNNYVIFRSQQELVSLSEGIKEAIKTSGPLAQRLQVNALPAGDVCFFHAAISLLLLTAILTAPF